MISSYRCNKKLTRAEREKVRSLSRAYGFDVGICLDFLRLFMGGTELTDAEFESRFEKFTQKRGNDGISPNLWKIVFTERQNQIRSVVELPLWNEIMYDSADNLAKLELLIATLAELHTKGRLGICYTCHLKSTCRYAVALERTKNSSLPNPKMAHPDCPLVPRPVRGDLAAVLVVLVRAVGDEILARALTRSGDNEFGELLKIALVGGGGPSSAPQGDSDTLSSGPGEGRGTGQGHGDSYVPSRTGSSLTHRIRKLLDLLRDSKSTGSVRLLMLAENFRKTVDLTAQEKITMKQSPEDPVDVSYRAMDTMDDVIHVDSSVLSLEDHEFDRRVAEGELVVRKPMTIERKSSLYFAELDVSGSMGGDSLTAAGPMSSGEVAVALLLAVISRAKKQKSGAGVQLFSGSPGERRFELDGSKLLDLAQWIALCDFNGSDTRIVSAIRAGFQQIKQARDGLGPDAEHVRLAECLLITDGIDDYLRNPSTIQSLLEFRTENDIRLNVLHICAEDGTDSEKALRRLSSQYVRVDPSNPDFIQMAGLMTPE